MRSWNTRAGPPFSMPMSPTTVEVASRAGPAHRDLVRVDAELRGVIRDPARGRIGVVDGGGELVLGGEAIVDGDSDTPRLIGQRAAGHIVGVEVTDDPASAVKEHEGGGGVCFCAPVAAPRNGVI